MDPQLSQRATDPKSQLSWEHLKYNKFHTEFIIPITPNFSAPPQPITLTFSLFFFKWMEFTICLIPPKWDPQEVRQLYNIIPSVSEVYTIHLLNITATYSPFSIPTASVLIHTLHTMRIRTTSADSTTHWNLTCTILATYIFTDEKTETWRRKIVAQADTVQK